MAYFRDTRSAVENCVKSDKAFPLEITQKSTPFYIRLCDCRMKLLKTCTVLRHSLPNYYFAEGPISSIQELTPKHIVGVNKELLKNWIAVCTYENPLEKSGSFNINEYADLYYNEYIPLLNKFLKNDSEVEYYEKTIREIESVANSKAEIINNSAEKLKQRRHHYLKMLCVAYCILILFHVLFLIKSPDMMTMVFIFDGIILLVLLCSFCKAPSFYKEVDAQRDNLLSLISTTKEQNTNNLLMNLNYSVFDKISIKANNGLNYSIYDSDLLGDANSGLMVTCGMLMFLALFSFTMAYLFG